MKASAAPLTLKKPNRAWIRPLQEGGSARYKQIAQQVAEAVQDGVLRPGDRLPTQRDLARIVGVDLTTVTRAYTELRQAGLLDAQGAGGTFIALSAADGETSVDLSMNIPPLLGSPLFARLIDSGMSHAREQLVPGELMGYHVGPGSRVDREAGAAWLAPALGPLPAERIVVCPGTQTAIAAVLLSRSRPGDAIAADPLTYPGFLAAARVLEREVVSVPSDDQGMRPDELERLCRERRPALLYLVPTIHNPTTTTLPLQRRQELLAIASRHGVTVIEDDPYWLLAGDAPPPLATLGTGAPVFHVSTLSKCLAPGLRTAYLVLPADEPAEPLLDALRSLTLMPPPAMLSMATYWIRNGQAGDMLAKIRQELGLRQQLAAALLHGQARAHPFGLHVWLSLPDALDQYRLIRTAREAGVGVASSEAFTLDDTPPNAIRISLGGAADHARLKTALSKLAELLSVHRRPSMPAIV